MASAFCNREGSALLILLGNPWYNVSLIFGGRTVGRAACYNTFYLDHMFNTLLSYTSLVQTYNHVYLIDYVSIVQGETSFTKSFRTLTRVYRSCTCHKSTIS